MQMTVFYIYMILPSSLFDPLKWAVSVSRDQLASVPQTQTETYRNEPNCISMPDSLAVTLNTRRPGGNWASSSIHTCTGGVR